jgi:hypothetical protein
MEATGRPRAGRAGLARLLAWVVLAGAGLTGCRGTRPPAAPAAAASAAVAEPSVRRLTAKQYRNTLTDLFGDGLVLPPLDEEPATGGFSTTGASQVGTSFQGVEQYLAAADAVARQVLEDETRRYTVVGCVPRARTDRDCAGRYLTRLGRSAFRRPLTEEEHRRFLDMAMATAQARSDFWSGLRVAVTALLASPSFIYVVERGRPQPDSTGRVPLTSWEIATRLSLFLWNTSPDPLLLDAAERDELADPAGLRRHVHRLLASPRAKEGLRNFFAELYRMDALDSVRRDKEKLPATSVRAIGRTMKEETMLVLEHNIFTERADFRKLFTTRDTFLNRDMAVLYGARVVDGGMFTKIMLATDSPRRGLLGHASFLAGTSAPDKTSPTIRGKYVREILLCEPVPAPPPDVDTNLPPAEGAHQTTRDRLEEHRLDFGCGKCHKLIDPIGLAFERFDHFGEYRELEHGQEIDPSGDLDGQPFADPIALGELLSRDPRVPACLMKNLYSYATGRIPGKDDQRALAALNLTFQRSGYKVWDALVALATSDSFQYLR